MVRQQRHIGQGRVLAILKLKPEISQRDLSYLLDMSKQSLAVTGQTAVRIPSGKS